MEKTKIKMIILFLQFSFVMKVMIREISAKFKNHRLNKEYNKDLINVILRQMKKI